MSADRDLTVLLTLKDRAPFTLRWLGYANGIGFPFKVLIADGSSDDGAAKVLADKSRFRNVDYEYVRYPFDESYELYYAKVADALARIRTPFVAMADNDDFFVVDSLTRAVRFLTANRDYVACGGQGAVFWIVNSDPGRGVSLLYGRNLRWKCTSDVQSVAADTARERIRGQSISTSDCFYYDVRRTEEALRQFRIVRELNLSDLFLVEHLLSFLTAVAGKTMRFEYLYMARQQNSPEGSGGTHTQKYGDWFGRMLVGSWSNDFTKFVHTLSVALSEADRISVEDARECIIACYRMLVAPSLLSNILEEPTVTMPMSVVVPVVRRLVRMPEDSILKRIARQIYRRTRLISLDAVYGTEFIANPVANAERDMKPILDFLARER